MMLLYQDAAEVKKVLFCSGKLYFELAERQQKEDEKMLQLIGWSNYILCQKIN